MWMPFLTASWNQAPPRPIPAAMLAANRAAAANATNSSIGAQSRIGALAYADIETPFANRPRRTSLLQRGRGGVVMFQFGCSSVSVLGRLQDIGTDASGGEKIHFGLRTRCSLANDLPLKQLIIPAPADISEKRR